MKQLKIPAVFMRGGTSNAVVFHAKDLPADRAQWDEIFLAAIGSPDPYGRQLDGMGGGVSSLSKVCVVGPPSRPDADIDYTFAQVQVKEAKVDYGANCGNMSSAMGPFAVDEGLLKAQTVRDQVRRHRVFGWYFLPAEGPLPESIANLREVHTVPRQLLEALAKEGLRITSLTTPFREHLAQHLAVTYSRIALPSEFESQAD